MLISQTKPALPPAPTVKRVPLTEAELIAAMKADAREIRKANYKIAERDIVQTETPEQVILDFVAANPGCTASEVAAACNRNPSNMRSRLCAMEARGQVRVEFFVSPHSHRRARKFYPVANPPKAKNGRPPKAKPSPQRDKVIAFIKANPGCTTPDLAKHMNCSHKMAAAHISQARKVVKIKSVRKGGNGNHVPAQHWVE